MNIIIFKMNVKLTVVFLVSFLFGSVKTGSSDVPRISTVYISKTRGTGRFLCGTLDLPCKTLSLGLNRLQWGGKLFIDGDGTDKSPYSCDSPHKLTITTSLFMESYHKKPVYFNCPNGIEFRYLENMRTSPYISVQGITFAGTKIILKDTTAVFNDCIFKESSLPIDVKVSKPVTQYALNVSNSLFQGNMGCIRMNSKNGRCNTVTLNLFNVVFKENLPRSKSCGLVVILGSSTDCKQIAVKSNWNNVTATHNSKVVANGKCTIAIQYHMMNSLIIAQANKVQLNFTHVTSENNTKMRFLGIFAHHYHVYINKSRFYGHHIDGEGGVLFLSSPTRKDTVTNITVAESEFANNSANKGAAISLKKGHKRTVNLRIINITFKDSYGIKEGCVVFVEVSTLTALLDNVIMMNCHHPCERQTEKKPVGICLLSVVHVRVNITNSHFIGNVNGSAVYIKHERKKSKLGKKSRPGSVDVVINNTRFTKNHATHRQSKDAVLYIWVKDPCFNTSNSRRIHIYNTTFLLNLGAIRIMNVAVVKVWNLSSLHNRDFSLELGYKTKKELDFQNSTILIQDSIFTGNEVPLHVTNKHPDVISISLKNTLFYQNNFGKIFALELESVNKKWFLTSGEVLLDRVNFTSNSLANSGGYLFGFHLFHNGHVKVIFSRCIFNNNYQQPGISRTIKSLMYFYMKKDVKNDSYHCPRFPEYTYNNTIFFDKVEFVNNTGSLSMLYLSSGFTCFRRCLFENNFSRHPVIGAHIYVEDQGTAALSIHNSSFVQNDVSLSPSSPDRLMQFVYAGANGPLQFTNTSFTSNTLTRIKSPVLTIQYGGFVWVDQKTDIRCPQGSLMVFENQSRILEANFTKDQQCTSNITRLAFSCVACPRGTYSLERGAFHGMTLKQAKTNCYSCPYGANCEWKIKSNENFWGYLKSSRPPKLSFTRCPQKYCKTSYHSSKYNSCYGNRTGTMCGRCREGYTECMFTKNCRSVEKCNDGSFWVITGIYLTVLALYMIYRPSISRMLIDKIFWFKRKEPVPPNSRIDEQFYHSSGYSKLLFYFYQIGDLLSVQPHHEIIHQSVFLASIISFFNFKIEKINSSSGCPFPGLNAVTKEVFRSFQVFAAMAVVLVIYMLYCVFCLLTRRARPYFAAYMAAIVEILLLGYERLGHTSLELLNCVPMTINDRTEWRLFLDGNITCWVHWWQYALIAYNIIFVLPFLVVLFIGTTKLRHQQITAVQFVAACFVPLPFLIYWLFKFCTRKSNQNIGSTSNGLHITAEALLEVIQGPFRSSKGNFRGTLCWDSILIGRRLVFLCLSSFISVPLMRSFIMTLICVCILVHNVLVMPYKEKKANSFAIVLLFIHVIIAITNLCQAVLITDGVFPRKPTKNVIDALMIVNIILLAIPPCLLALLITAALLSQIARLLVLVTGYVCLRNRRETSVVEYIDDEYSYRPLLSPTEED